MGRNETSEADVSKLIKYGDKSILTITMYQYLYVYVKIASNIIQTKMVLGDLLYGSLAFLQDLQTETLTAL